MRVTTDFTIYNSWDTSFKTPFGAVKTGEKVVFRIALPKTISPQKVLLHIFPIDEEGLGQLIPMDLEESNFVANYYCCSYASDTPFLLGYYFEVVSNNHSQFIKKGKTSAGTFGKGENWQLSVYDKEMKTPAVFGDGVIYQIFPDRFYNSGSPKEGVPSDRHLRDNWGELPTWRPDPNGQVLNNDYFRGDLRGVEEKLDYLVCLGVSLVYLNPIFEAHTSHRYDTADYRKIDPLLGTEQDFERLCKAAAAKGIHIILDGVFNHTGSDSVYFNKNRRYGNGGAYNDQNSPYYPWYRFRNFPNDYDSWWDFSTLPNVNEEDESYQQFICGEDGVLDKWLKLGAAGYRLDVADELPDSFLDKIHNRVKATRPDATIVGEVWEDASNKVSYGVRRRYLLGGQLDSVMNYPFKDAILSYIREGNGGALYATILKVIENYPPPALACLMNIISTHDTPRAITTLVGEPLGDHGREWQHDRHYLPIHLYEQGKKLLTLAMVLQFCLPGIPCIYYGDEAGLSGYRDPFNRICYPWDHQDDQLLAVTTALGKVRKTHPWLACAPLIPLAFGESVVTFLRQNGDETILIAINRGNSPQPIGYHIPENAQCIFSSEYSNAETLNAYGAAVFYWSAKGSN